MGKKGIFLFLSIALAILGGVYFLAPVGQKLVYLSPAAAVLSVAGMLLVILSLHHPRAHLERSLQHMAKLIRKEPLSVLKRLYLEIYHLYLKLPEHYQGRYFKAVMQIRGQLEEAMAAEKRLQALLDRAEQQTLEGFKRTWIEVEREFQKLPQKVQSEHYPRILAVRQKKEKGI